MVIDKVVAFKQKVLASTSLPRRKRKKAFVIFARGAGGGGGRKAGIVLI